MRARIEVKGVPRASRSSPVTSAFSARNNSRASGAAVTVRGSGAVSGPGVIPARLPAGLRPPPDAISASASSRSGGDLRMPVVSFSSG
jgi:hypothetical protein